MAHPACALGGAFAGLGWLCMRIQDGRLLPGGVSRWLGPGALGVGRTHRERGALAMSSDSEEEPGDHFPSCGSFRVGSQAHGCCWASPGLPAVEPTTCVDGVENSV